MMELLKVRGFTAFLLVAFINAFVDLGHKITIQNTVFKAYEGDLQIILTSIVNGLILLPFVLLLTPSGYLSDKYPKNLVMRYSAWAAVAITLLITLSYYQGWFITAFALTFLLALQSALYSPAKYGFIKEIVGKERLSEGNGWVQSVTMVAILSGIIAFSALFEIRIQGATELQPEQSLQLAAPLGWLLVLGSLVELILCYRLPQLRETDTDSCFDWHGYKRGQTLKRNLDLLGQKRAVVWSVAGLVTFWAISQVMLAVFPAYAEQHLDQHNIFVIQGVMALSGIGIMLGSALAGRWSRQYINLGLVPLGAVGVAVGLLLLPQLTDMRWQALVFLLIGTSGALVVIPLNAFIQFNSPLEQLGKVLAGYNFVEKGTMLLALSVTAIFAYFGLDGMWLLWSLAILGVLGAIAAIILLPQAIIRRLLAMLFNAKYRLEVLGFEHIPAEGKGVLLLGNHISWLDWAMIQLACPRHITFVMERAIYERWYLKWFLDLYGVIPVSRGAYRTAMKEVGSRISRGEVVCIFPEGAISHNGQLGEFKRGFERACQDADGVIVPFYLRGLWGSRFSRSTDRLRALRRSGLKRDVIVAFGQTLPINSPASEVKLKIHEMSMHAWQAHTDSLRTVGEAFVDTAKAAPNDWAVTDVRGKPLSHIECLSRSIQLSKELKDFGNQPVAVLLPTSRDSVVANMAIMLAGKVVLNIDARLGKEVLISQLQQANVKVLISSADYLSQLEQQGIDGESLQPFKLLKIEDSTTALNRRQSLAFNLMLTLLPTALVRRLYCNRVALDDTAAIIFTRREQDKSVAVQLSHRNLMSNLKQVADVINIQDQDCVMSALPFSNAYGLTVTLLMPLIEGIPFVCHSNSYDAINVGKGVARYKATLLFAVPKMLEVYQKSDRLHPLMFKSLRVVVSGLHRLNNVQRVQFETKFRTEIVEGYGCTETTPVVCVNLPDAIDTNWWLIQKGHKPGTVGLPLPGSMIRIVDEQSYEPVAAGKTGKVMIGGSQIMNGYLQGDSAPSLVKPVLIEKEGIRWYLSNDYGFVDEDGFLTLADKPLFQT